MCLFVVVAYYYSTVLYNFLEYAPTAYMRRKFLSGFGGSFGTCVVTNDDALLWTDSRYWNEAGMQLDSSLWSLMKQGQPKVPTIAEYLSEKAVKKQDKTAATNGEEIEGKTLRVGIDPFVFPSKRRKLSHRRISCISPEFD
jgi:hypothetical protein